jgi:hypothetical protein
MHYKNVLSREKFALVIAGSYKPSPKVVLLDAVANIKAALAPRLLRLSGTRMVHAFAFVHVPQMSADAPLHAAFLHKHWCSSPQWLGDAKEPTLCMAVFKRRQVPSARDLAAEVGPAAYQDWAGETWYAGLVKGLEVLRSVSSFKLQNGRLSPFD